MDALSYFGYFLVRRAPILLLTLGGVVFALIRWKRHPKVSLLTIIGLSFLLIQSLVYTIVLYQLPFIFESLRVDYGSQQTYYTVLYVLYDIAYAFVIVLLVAAAFSQRQVQTISEAK
ncbi:MAG TPA: hypothetical protein VFH31_09045 [Pyrinomonadaceae bacterium]|nr:hypothetical protein [Pyrinomonadaceae bacterium]